MRRPERARLLADLRAVDLVAPVALAPGFFAAARFAAGFLRAPRFGFAPGELLAICRLLASRKWGCPATYLNLNAASTGA